MVSASSSRHALFPRDPGDPRRARSAGLVITVCRYVRTRERLQGEAREISEINGLDRPADHVAKEQR
jgi:hypothetical protein